MPSLFVRYSSIDTPSLLHRISIVSPSKRWSIDGLSMDNRWIISEESRVVIVVGKSQMSKVYHPIRYLKNVSLILINVIIYNKIIINTSFMFIFFCNFINFASRNEICNHRSR